VVFCYVVLLLDGLVHAFLDYRYVFALDGDGDLTILLAAFHALFLEFQLGYCCIALLAMQNSANFAHLLNAASRIRIYTFC
jgi:hypothetical protein